MEETKICSKCKEDKPLTQYHKHPGFKSGLNSWCKACHRIKSREYCHKYRDKTREYFKHYYRDVKNQVIAGYGGKCACCGEAERLFLTLDHVNGGGRQDRKSRGSNACYLEALNLNFPPKYQVLCYNCNCTKGFYGACPHEAKKQNA